MDNIDAKVMRNNDIVVLSMYVVKTAAKAVVGSLVGSAALTSDAVHNVADIAQYIGISISTRIANRHDSKRYPAGRKALEAIVALLIGVTLLYLALQFMVSGVHKSLNVFGAVDWLESAFTVNLGFLRIEEVRSTSLPLAVVATLSVAALLSYVVFKIEMRNAAVLRSPALKGDAEELKSDMWVEISVAVGFLAARLFNLTSVDAVAQIVISVLVWRSGWDIVKENGPKLQGRAISEIDRKRILEALLSIEGIVSDDSDPENHGITVRAYYAGGDRIRVECLLLVNATSGQNIQLITSLAETRIKQLLEPTYDHVDVFASFQLHQSTAEADHVTGAIDQYLRSVWGIAVMRADMAHRLVEHYVSSQFGAALALAQDAALTGERTDDGTSSRMELLSLYIAANCRFWLTGTRNSETADAFREIERVLQKKEDIESNTVVALQNALAFFRIEEIVANGRQSAGAEMRGVREMLQATYGNTLIDDSVRAEAAHFLARSYYKISGYDLEKARDWFKKARDVTISAGTPYASLFSARIWTDWGNLEAQFHHLDEAERYLTLAKDLKLLQKDKYGLAINYGCLATVAAKRGEFERAVKLYEEDLKLVAELGTDRDKPHVLCKIADIEVKQALLTDDRSRADDAVSVAQAAREADSGAFFSLKALFKAQFAVWWLNLENSRARTEAATTLEALVTSAGESPNLYLRGILNRLRGRYAAATADVGKARELFAASQRCFAGIDSGTDLPIQACLSDVEALRWSVVAMDAAQWTIEINAKMGELSSLMATVGFHLPPKVSVPNSVEIKKIRKSLDAVLKNDLKDPVVLRELNKRLERIDYLIWFLEL
ncbi:MAG: cation diffusion facilitator family transporter [Candidatus Zixiibacteriota bacterium]